MSDELENEIAIWSLIFEKIVTLEELENTWSLDDLIRAHAILEMRSEMIEEERRANNVNC